jgi:hypothetical protein
MGNMMTLDKNPSVIAAFVDDDSTNTILVGA